MTHRTEIKTERSGPTQLWSPWGETPVPRAGERFALLRKLAERVKRLPEAAAPCKSDIRPKLAQKASRPVA